MIKEKSITKNSVFYLIYQVLNVLFPFVSAIYVSRILLPQYIGRVAYAQNVAQYFVILSFLGLPTYGLREVSKARSNKIDLNHIYSELMIINSISTVVFSVMYLIVICSFSKFKSDIFLFLIYGSLIFANILNNSWLYEGLEEFKYISLRNIVFKSLSLLSLILIVRNRDDYYKYALINVLAIIGNYIINIVNSRKYVRFTIHDLNFSRHLRPIFTLVIVNLAIELYSLVDVTMLGFFSNEENIAFYSYGIKIYKVGLQIINAFTIVVVPRLALYKGQSDDKKFNELLSKTFWIIILLSVPMIIGIEMIGKDVICLLYGNRYANSGNVLRMLAPLLFISPTSYLLGSRVMLVNNEEKKMAVSVFVGAIVNVLGNYILIPKIHEFGAALASCISEIVVMSVYIMFAHSYFHLKIRIKELIKILVSSTSMVVVILIINALIKGHISKLIMIISVSILIYFGLLYVLKESFVTEKANRIIQQFKVRYGKKI